MSYDFTIRPHADDSLGLSSSLVSQIILRSEGIRLLSRHYLELNIPESGLEAGIYLEFVDEEGSTVEWAGDDTLDAVTNCIRVCIPYANMSHDEALRKYSALISTIAADLNWRGHDEQTGKSL